MKVSQNLKRRPSSAYTLVEVVVAVLVLGVVGTGYYAALSSGFAVVQSTREDLRATQILAQKIEAVRLCTWSQLTNFNFQEAYDPLSTNAQSSGTMFYGNVELASSSAITNGPAYYPNLKQVTVNLRWTNYNGKVPIPHSRLMQTQVARYGLQNYIWGVQ